MGFIADSINKPGPGIEKDTPPKKGLARFWEIFTRNFTDLFRLNLFVAICFIPSVAFFCLFFFATNKPLLFLILGYLCLIPAGVALCAMNKVILKMIRDIPGFVWHDFKNAYKENFKQSAIFSAIYFVFVLLLGYAGYILLFVNKKTDLLLMAALFMALVTIISIGNFAFAQIATVKLPLTTIFKNSILLTIGRANRCLPAILIQIIIFGACILFLPYTAILFLVGLISLSALITLMWLWPALKLVCAELCDEQLAQEERDKNKKEKAAKKSAKENGKKSSENNIVDDETPENLLAENLQDEDIL